MAVVRIVRTCVASVHPAAGPLIAIRLRSVPEILSTVKWIPNKAGMFSTILKEVTGYFDRRALLSAFFPSLVFWGLLLAVVIGTGAGWQSSIKVWQELNVTATALLLLGFFVWVTFWSFLTLNLRPALIRLYEGNWPIKRLQNWRRGFWQQRHREEAAADYELELQAIAVDDIRIALKTLRGWLASRTPGLADDRVQAFTDSQQSLENALSGAAAPSSDDLQSHLDRVQGWLREIEPTLIEEPIPDDHEWAQRRKAIAKTERRLDSIFPELTESRGRLKRNFSLYFPPEIYGVMPTRLGNVLRTVEIRVWKRYHLDVVIVWSRLQPDLPKEFSETLQDAKMSLDMMITLSAYAVFFGGLMAAWFAYHLPRSILIVGPFVLLVALPLISHFALHLSKDTTIRNTQAAVLLVILTLGAAHHYWPQLVLVGYASLGIQSFLVLMIAACLLAWGIYLNAVQAGLAYAEKIQASFDLYRWKVFDEFHLKLPPSLEEERHMWKELSLLLSSSKTPSGDYYAYTKQEQTKEPVPSTISLPVLAKTKPPFGLIAATDLIELDFVESKINADTARTRDELINKRTLQNLAPCEPILRSLVTDDDHLTDTVAVGISVRSASTLGGGLQPGDKVDVIIVPAVIAPNSMPLPVMFENLRVLDIKLANNDSESVVVVALPSTRQIEFAANSLDSKVVITRRPHDEAA